MADGNGKVKVHIAMSIQECYAIQDRARELAQILYMHWMRVRRGANETEMEELAKKANKAADIFSYHRTVHDAMERMAWAKAAEDTSQDACGCEECSGGHACMEPEGEGGGKEG